MYECLDCKRICIEPEKLEEDEEISICPYCGSDAISERDEQK